MYSSIDSNPTPLSTRLIHNGTLTFTKFTGYTIDFVPIHICMYMILLPVHRTQGNNNNGRDNRSFLKTTKPPPQPLQHHYGRCSKLLLYRRYCRPHLPTIALGETAHEMMSLLRVVTKIKQQAPPPREQEHIQTKKPAERDRESEQAQACTPLATTATATAAKKEQTHTHTLHQATTPSPHLPDNDQAASNRPSQQAYSTAVQGPSSLTAHAGPATNEMIQRLEEHGRAATSAAKKKPKRQNTATTRWRSCPSPRLHAPSVCSTVLKAPTSRK